MKLTNLAITCFIIALGCRADEATGKSTHLDFSLKLGPVEISTRTSKTQTTQPKAPPTLSNQSLAKCYERLNSRYSFGADKNGFYLYDQGTFKYIIPQKGKELISVKLSNGKDLKVRKNLGEATVYDMEDDSYEPHYYSRAEQILTVDESDKRLQEEINKNIVEQINSLKEAIVLPHKNTVVIMKPVTPKQDIIHETIAKSSNWISSVSSLDNSVFKFGAPNKVLETLTYCSSLFTNNKEISNAMAELSELKPDWEAAYSRGKRLDEANKTIQEVLKEQSTLQKYKGALTQTKKLY